MKWTYYINQKLRVAFFLFCIMACIILVRLLVDQSVRYLHTSVRSLYDDRLVPSSDLFHIADNLHKKKYALLEFASQREEQPIMGVEELQNQLAHYDRQIEALVQKYGGTYLVLNEKDHLGDFKKLFDRSIQLERDFLVESATTSSSLAYQEVCVALDQAIHELAAMEKIQTQVGKEITTDVQSLVKGIHVYSLFQIVLSIIIGTMVVALVLASKSMILRKQEPYHLN